MSFVIMYRPAWDSDKKFRVLPKEAYERKIRWYKRFIILERVDSGFVGYVTNAYTVLGFDFPKYVSTQFIPLAEVRGRFHAPIIEDYIVPQLAELLDVSEKEAAWMF